ncbi:MAG TPA: THUMP domain-containing protein [Casimicrobiaceae bacterium]|nr:THUMP domain-containing protein [Casimicrobiaceae bacterium]
MPEQLFAPCPRGLESALADELRALQARDVDPREGGVAFAGDFALACKVNLWSRLASRVLWRVASGPYRDESDIHALARAVDWPRLFRGDRTLRVDVAATRSPLRSLEFATLRIKDAIVDCFRDATGTRPSVDKRAPDVRINAYLTADQAIVYLDTSGEPLFKRGYRGQTEEAPLRENLAAGLVALAQWHGDAPLLDPMCGGGTILVEAAMIAANRAPGLARTFGFQKLAWFDGPEWQRMKQAARDAVRPAPQRAVVFGSDIAQAAVDKTRAHLAAAKVEGFAELTRADVRSRPAPESHGTLIANPPYGVRMAEARELAALYPQLGDALKQRFAGWTAYLFTADLRLPKLIGLKPARRIPLFNGALECRLFVFPLVHGGHRREGPLLK